MTCFNNEQQLSPNHAKDLDAIFLQNIVREAELNLAEHFEIYALITDPLKENGCI